jgi:predicted acetyltransferase
MTYEYKEKFQKLENQQLLLTLISYFPGNEKEIPFYWYEISLKETGQKIGKISIRLGMNKDSYFNGNIGYEIDEPFRGHAYSLKAAKMVLKVARAYGMKDLIISCQEDNLASAKIIEALGGELLEIAPIPQDYFAYQPGLSKQRIYRLDLKEKNSAAESRC